MNTITHLPSVPFPVPHRSLRAAGVAALGLALAFVPLVLSAAPDPRDEEIKLLREQIRLLDTRLRQLEAKDAGRAAAPAAPKSAASTASSTSSASSAGAPEAAASAARVVAAGEKSGAAQDTPKITLNDRGITLASADGDSALRLRALVQADSRWFSDAPASPGNEGFLLRRARIIFEGRFGRLFQYQIVPEYGGSGVYLLDGNINLAFAPGLQVKFGKFKAPVGLELLQSDSWAFFPERSLATNLVPNRDIGAQLGGELFGRTIEYQLAVLNGIGEGRSNQTNAEFDRGKDFVARVFARPFRNRRDSFLQGLGIGIAGSAGRQKGELGRAAGYRTDAQQTLFSYRSNIVVNNVRQTVIQDGSTWRCTPQLSYYNGPFGLLGEYVVSTVNLRAAAGQPSREITSKAWQVAAGCVVTGEKSSFNGVTPKNPFNLEKGTWGALELAARFDRLDIDNDAFPALADPDASATAASSWTLGANWYLTRAFRFSLNYIQTDLRSAIPGPTGATGALLREGEKAIITRAQIAF
jgi:phosphate-selective porin OprO/OprP